MSHREAMAGRLPTLYREGELVGELLRIPELVLEILDQEALEVQRAHWFDRALTLDEAARLAALLAIPAESWQSLAEYRAWLHSLRDALLQQGAVTVDAIRGFVSQYARLYQANANLIAIAQLERWSAQPSTTAPALVENPPVRRFQRIPALGGVEPLWQFSVENRGLDPTPLDLLLTGLAGGPESVPALVNLTTGTALLFLGNLEPGQRLWISANPDGTARAWLERRDVSSALRSVTDVRPGTPWEQSQVQVPARALSLARGRNELWFLPLAHFDALGLDRFLLALADLALQQGRFEAARFDQALFYQDPAASLQVAWVETSPASLRVELPGGALRNSSGRTTSALQSRDELGTSLELAVQQLRGVGIAASVTLEPLREQQPQRDYLVATLPITIREAAPMGADRMPESGGVYDVTRFSESTFR